MVGWGALLAPRACMPAGAVAMLAAGGTAGFGGKGGGRLTLASALKQRHLSPHTTVELEITTPNDIGEVVIFTIVSNQQPTEAFRCLPPGARAARACTSA
jgi:hypothetical protein